ncbi:MAG: hypothetical protein Kow00121_37940 [Elainellaceae cyanobacterium]
MAQQSSPAPAPALLPPAPTPSVSPSPADAELTQTYRQPQGAFEISLPKDYKYEETETGLIFGATDESFRGEVVFGSAQGEKYTNQQLEEFLKEAYKSNLKLADVQWQQTEVQADGSVRLDWVGTDPQGNVLDAESFIEQRGDTIFILTLSGINKPYIDYVDQAQAIVSSYRVQQTSSDS